MECKRQVLVHLSHLKAAVDVGRTFCHFCRCGRGSSQQYFFEKSLATKWAIFFIEDIYIEEREGKGGGDCSSQRKIP